MDKIKTAKFSRCFSLGIHVAITPILCALLIQNAYAAEQASPNYQFSPAMQTITAKTKQQKDEPSPIKAPESASTESLPSDSKLPNALPNYRAIRKMVKEGQRDSAKDFAEIILREKPNHHDLRILYARLHAWDKNYTKAEEELNYVLAKKPEYVDARLALIDMTLWQKNYSKAIKIANGGLVLTPGNDELMYRKALAYQRWDKPGEATIVLNQILEQHPNDKQAQELLAKLHRSTVTAEVEKPETYGEVDLPSYKEVQQLAKTGRREAARKKGYHILKHKPDYHDVRNLVARTHAWDKQYKQAVEQAQKVLAASPDNEDALMVLIDIAIWTKDYQRAIVLANQGIRIDITNPEFLYKKAVAYARMRQYDKASETLDKLFDIRQDYPKGLELLGQLERRAPVPYIKGLFKFSMAARYDTVDDIRSPWRTGHAALSKRTPFGTIIGRVSYASRFNLTPGPFDATTYQYEIEAYPKFIWGSYFYLDYAYSDWRLFPLMRYDAEWYWNVPMGWEFSFGKRYTNFRGTKYHIYTGTIAKYIGNWWISLRPSYRAKDKGVGQSYRLTVRRFFSDPDHYLELKLSGSNNPDDSLIDFITGGIDSLDTGSLQGRGIGVQYRFPVAKQLYLKIACGYRKQVYRFRTRRVRGIGGGFDYHF